MTWFKVDDGFPAHRKVEALQGMPPATYTAAITIWTLMGADCGLNLSDGVFSRVRLRKITGLPDKLLDAGLAALVKVGLFDRAGDECAFHDWAAMQPTRAQIEAQRAMKSAAGRSGGLASGESRAKQVLPQNEAGASRLAKQNASTPLPNDEARARVRNPDPTRPDQEENPPTPASGGVPGGRKPRAPRLKAEAQPELLDPSRPSVVAALEAVEAASGGRFVVPRGAAYDRKLTRTLQELIDGFPDLAAWSRVGRWLASWDRSTAILSADWLTNHRDAFAKAEAWEGRGGNPLASGVFLAPAADAERAAFNAEIERQRIALAAIPMHPEALRRIEEARR